VYHKRKELKGSFGDKGPLLNFKEENLLDKGPNRYKRKKRI
jgi:hypothetical protein